MKRKTTIKDVAEKAGVSIATVSRVVNKNYYVSPKISDRVLEAIQTLGYYPNSIARSLKSNTTYTIAFLMSDISNKYFNVMAKAIEDVISKRAYNIIVCSTDGNREREIAYLKTLLSKKVDGIILDTTGKNYDFIADISRMIPMVVVHRRILNLTFHGDFVGANNRSGAYELTRHVIAAGHRKIAVLNGLLFTSSGSDRFEGFKLAISEAGIALPDSYRADGDFLEHSGFEVASYFMRQSEPPTAIVIMNNEMTIGALKYLQAHAIRVPDDVSIATYNNIENIELMHVQPSLITQNPRAIATRASQLILERIEHPDIHNREVIFEPQLIPGNSVAPPRIATQLLKL